MEESLNERALATALENLTYSEMMEFAKYISGAACDWMDENKAAAYMDVLDGDYFAMLLSDWRENTRAAPDD